MAGSVQTHCGGRIFHHGTVRVHCVHTGQAGGLPSVSKQDGGRQTHDAQPAGQFRVSVGVDGIDRQLGTVPCGNQLRSTAL